MVALAFNPRTREAEAGGSLWNRGQPGLQELVPGQLLLLHRETLPQKNENKKIKMEKADFIRVNFSHRFANKLLLDLEKVFKSSNSCIVHHRPFPYHSFSDIYVLDCETCMRSEIQRESVLKEYYVLKKIHVFDSTGNKSYIMIFPLYFSTIFSLLCWNVL